MSDCFKVIWSNKVQKQLAKIPSYVAIKFYGWVAEIQFEGLLKTRTSLGYHDELLKGSRRGQKSIRLNKAYRAIYVEKSDGTIEFIEVLEVNKHDY